MYRIHHRLFPCTTNIREFDILRLFRQTRATQDVRCNIINCCVSSHCVETSHDIISQIFNLGNRYILFGRLAVVTIRGRSRTHAGRV